MMKVVRSALMASILLVCGLAHAEDGAGGPVAGDEGKEVQAVTVEELHDGLVQFEKGDFNAALHMRIQGWGGWVADDASLENGDRMQETGFMLRRARFGVSGDFMTNVSYNLEMDLFDQERAGGPLYAAWMAYNPSHLIGAKLGVQPFPFLKGQIMSSGMLPHLDRSVGSNAMSPENTMGITLRTEPWEKHLALTAGVFNGLRAAPTFFGGYEGVGVSLGNRFEELSYAGRIDFQPLAPIGCGIGDVSQGQEFRLALGGAAFYNDGSTIMTYGYSAYLQMKFMGFHLFAEFAQDHAEPQDEPTTTATAVAETERRVITGSLGYVFLKDMLGLAVRAELLDDNLDQDTQGDEMQISGTLTWYLRGDYLKAQLEYTHREELHGISLENDTAMGGVQLLF